MFCKTIEHRLFIYWSVCDFQLDLSHEALPPEQENADFIALSKDSFPCAGCPFDLDKNVEGVSELINLAVKHIESEKTQRHKITNVRRLQEQVQFQKNCKSR